MIDFDHGCGGLTAGMERYGEFLVIDNVYLNPENELCYNNTHINPFWTEAYVSPDDYDILDIKVACFSPNMGGQIKRSGRKNIDLSELYNQMRWVNEFSPEVVIFSMQPAVLPHLNIFDKKDLEPYTVDGWPYFDMLLSYLHQINYRNVAQFTFNYTDFNIPIDKKVAFYIAWKNNRTINLYYPNITHRRTPIDVLSNITQEDDKWHSPNFQYSHNCSFISPGSRASQTNELGINSGYIRLMGNKMAPNLLSNFYLPSSKGASIHPTEDRPLTIREGALLNGLDLPFTWDTKLSNKKVATMIVDSVSPIIGYYFAQSVFELLA